MLAPLSDGQLITLILMIGVGLYGYWDEYKEGKKK